MRFLFVSELEPNADSGAAGSILAIGEALERRGHAVEFLWREAQARRLSHQTLDDLLCLPRRQLRRVDEHLARNACDVVVVSQPYAYLLFERLPRRYPSTLFVNRTHGWEDRLDRSRRQLGWARPTRFSRRVLEWASATGRRRASRRSARAAHGVIACSSADTSFVVTSYGIPAHRVATIPYGLDAQFRHIAASSAIAKSGRRMLYVGQYMPMKGSGVLQRLLPVVARRHPGVCMTFVVQREAVEGVRGFFEPHFGHRLSVRSWIPREELATVYCQHDVFLFPSLFEGFGKTFLEAMACGLCVVGFAEGGLADIAAPTKEALSCAVGDEAGFLSLVEQALRDPAGARAIGDRARLRVRDLSWERNAEETERFCVALAEQRTALRRRDAAFPAVPGS